MNQQTEILQQNALFHADALVALERLPTASVIVAYLDPPWFSSFGMEQFQGKKSENQSKDLAIFLAKVTQQIRRILKDEGSLFIHWSPDSPLDIRLIMSQAFGDRPKYEITLIKKKIGHFPINRPRTESEFILVYNKSEDFIYKPVFVPHSEENSKRYNKQDERGPFSLSDLTSPFHRPLLNFPWRGYQIPTGRSWRFTRERLEELANDNRVYFPTSGTDIPSLKRYLSESQGVELGTTWDDISSRISPSERVNYPVQQPIALMNRILELASNEGDWILDPFCGSGTSLVAAQSLNRKWIGIDNHEDAKNVVIDRIKASCNLTADLDYILLRETDLVFYPTNLIQYKDVITEVSEITNLQERLSMLIDHIFNMKSIMNISDDAKDQDIEAVITQMEVLIAKTINNQRSVDSYIQVVCSWLIGWDQLNEASQAFLPQAELLYENIVQTQGKDFSPFIIQYCRALENELLTKLFSAYTEDIYSRHTDVITFVNDDFNNQSDKIKDKLKTLVTALKKRQSKYTLGEMSYIMSLLEPGGNTLRSSAILKDFQNFTINYFGEKIVERKYLNQIKNINEDFRKKSAHPYVLDREVADHCRSQVRTCINELISNYNGI